MTDDPRRTCGHERTGRSGCYVSTGSEVGMTIDFPTCSGKEDWETYARRTAGELEAFRECPNEGDCVAGLMPSYRDQVKEAILLGMEHSVEVTRYREALELIAELAADPEYCLGEKSVYLPTNIAEEVLARTALKEEG